MPEVFLFEVFAGLYVFAVQVIHKPCPMLVVKSRRRTRRKAVDRWRWCYFVLLLLGPVAGAAAGYFTVKLLVLQWL